MKTGKLTEKNLGLLCLASVILLTGLWGLLTFNKLAPTSEGWYVTYAKMILAGKVPYRDFELVFPPLYTFFNLFVIKIFGEHLIVFRIIGVLLYIGLGVLAYYIFKLLFPSWIAAVAALVAMFMQQSEVVNIMYDYVRFYDLFNNLAFFLMLRLFIKLYKKEAVSTNRNMFFIGLCTAMAMLFRQSSGIIVFAYFTLFLILVFFFVKDLKIKVKNMLFFGAGVLVPLFITSILLVAVGAFVPFIQMTFLTGSKGSLGAVLFNWIPRWIELNFASLFFMVFMVIIAFYFIRSYKNIGENNDETIANERNNFITYFVLIGITILLISLMFLTIIEINPLIDLNPFTTVAFTLNIVLGIIFLIRIIRKLKEKQPLSLAEITYVFFCGFIFAVGFGCGTSAGLAIGQAALSFGFITAIILGEVRKSKIEKYLGMYVSLAFCLIIITVSFKISTPYSWWGLTTRPYDEASQRVSHGYFNGIKVSNEEKIAYEGFTAQTKLHLGADDQLYCYGQMPIFYTLANKMPQAKAVVTWFDVSQDKTILEDLEFLTSNNPKMILFADHGLHTLAMHEELFRNGQASGQRQLYEWMLWCRDDEESGYSIVDILEVQNYKIYLLVKDASV